MPVRLVDPDWPAPGCVLAGTTTRDGGISKGPWESLNLGKRSGDDPAAVAENRRRLAEVVGGAIEYPRQVHGTNARNAGNPDPSPADSVHTRTPGEVCAILTADCLPILLCTRAGDWVAAVHAGWRGLAAGVIERCLAAANAPPGSLLAWIGPGISQAHFEVGSEVRAAFLDSAPEDARYFIANRRGRWQADLPGLARRRLATAGVTETYGGNLCTFEGQRFFSYRRDGTTGRMASFIVIRHPSQLPENVDLEAGQTHFSG